MLGKATAANNYHYNKNLLDYARQLRLHSTKAEIYFWNDVLKNGSLNGYKFQRQRPVLKYIADFMCFDLMLVIEVDGITHELESVAIKDDQKTIDLEAVGFTVIRYSDWEVLERKWDIAEELMDWIANFELRKSGHNQ